MRPLVFLTAGLLLASCDKNRNLFTDAGLPSWWKDAVGLPQDLLGRPILMEISGSILALEPTLDDPLVRLGGCTDRISHCFAPPSKGLKGCVEDSACEGADCCPSACVDAFHAALASGQTELESFEQTFFTAPDCFPGVRDALEGR